MTIPRSECRPFWLTRQGPFVREGYLRKQFRKDGQFLDAVVYALLGE